NRTGDASSAANWDSFTSRTPAAAASSANRTCCASASGLDGVTRYARVTPSSAASRQRGSSKLPTTTVADAFGSLSASLEERARARATAPRLSSCCSTADPVLPVAPVTRIRSAAGIGFSHRRLAVLWHRTVLGDARCKRLGRLRTRSQSVYGSRLL